MENEIKAIFVRDHVIQIKVEYSAVPPQVFLSNLRKFCCNKENAPGCSITLEWEQVPRPAGADAPGEQGKRKLFSLLYKLTIVHRAKGVCTPKRIHEVSSVSGTQRGRRSLYSLSMLPVCNCATSGFFERLL